MQNKMNDSIFKNKNFLLLFFGKLISQLGDSIFTFALVWYLMERTGAAVQSGIIMALSIIPSIVLGPVGGIIADRFNRIKIIVLMDIIRGIIMIILIGILYVGNLSMPYIYVSIILLSIFGTLFTPACTAVIPNIVGKDKLFKANSLDSIVINASQIFGALLGAVIFQILGIEGVLIINAVSFLGSGIFEMFIKLNNKQEFIKASNESKVLNSYIYEIKDGFKYLYKNRALFLLFLFLVFWNFLIYPIMQVYLPYIFNNILHTSAVQLSLVQIAFGMGVVVASFTSYSNKKMKSYSKQIVNSYLIVSLVLFINTLTLLPVMREVSVDVVVIIFFIVSFVCGIFIGRGYIPVSVVYQKDIPDEIRGRVNSIVLTFEKVAVPMGFIFAGLLTQTAEMYILNALFTGTLIVACLLLRKSKEVQKL